MKELLNAFFKAQKSGAQANIDLHISHIQEQGVLVTVFGELKGTDWGFYDSFFTGEKYFNKEIYQKCLNWLNSLINEKSPAGNNPTGEKE